MRSPITLPKLLGFRLRGFAPILKGDVVQNLRTGPNIILGGNGLGKTTVMQAIIYGLTGGTNDEAVEDQKRLRWDHGYFRERLSASGSGSVEVDFAFGDQPFSLRRGFRGSDVTAFRAGKKGKWNENANEAAVGFRRAIREFGGYQTPQDFSFVVNRLLYLPETRRLIAWDTQSQVRLLMVVNQDAVMEEKFRKRQEQLRQLDSQKRHLHVVIGKLEQQISTSSEIAGYKQSEQDRGKNAGHETATNLGDLVDRLRKVTRERVTADANMASAAKGLSDVSLEVEGLRERIELIEATLVEGFLSKQERESALALHKLAESGICPACGTVQPELQAEAEQRSRNGLCMLCGSELRFESSNQLNTVRSQLKEKIRSQEAVGMEHLLASAKLQGIIDEQESIQTEVNQIRSEQPSLTLLERSIPIKSGEDLLIQKDELARQEADLEAQIVELRQDLERDYKRFRDSIDSRLQGLHAAYSEYATAFLGLSCDLAEVPQGQMMSLSIFVPKFGETVRPNEESCSEAQRFFLDIAFRMALIDLASDISDGSGTFICETPETALDMSYVDNVVKMFRSFAKKGHNLILTANVQTDGIAQKLLADIPRTERASHVLNLFDIGQLSDVHRADITRLKQAISKTLS